jgi:small-conductance mechanosensitive channel
MRRFGVLALGQLSVFGADHAPATLTGSCAPDGEKPGLACQLVWDVSHNYQAASLTREFFAGPVHLLLQVLFVVLLALIIQWIVHRLINRLTERAAHSFLGRNGNRYVAGRATARRFVLRRRVARRQRRSATDDPIADDAAAVKAAGGGPAGGGPAASPAPVNPAAVNPAAVNPVLVQSAAANPAVGLAEDAADENDPTVINGAAAQAESALVDERRKQRVRALGAILRSAASVTIFSIAGFIVLGDLGLNLAPLLASAGVVGVAIGFGAQSLVRDYLSGIFMLVEDQYGVGDVITVGDATGTVENVTLRITRMRDVNGIVWHIRNGAIETLGNESQGWARAVIDFPIPFEADLAAIRALLAQTGDEMWNDPVWRVVMLEAPEVWGAQEISSSEVTMRIVVKTAPLRQWEVEREMRARVKHALHEAGILPAAAAD